LKLHTFHLYQETNKLKIKSYFTKTCTRSSVFLHSNTIEAHNRFWISILQPLGQTVQLTPAKIMAHHTYYLQLSEVWCPTLPCN